MSPNLLAMRCALVGGSHASNSGLDDTCDPGQCSKHDLALRARTYTVQAHKDVPFRGGVEGVEGARDRGRAFLEAQRGQEDPRAHAR